MHAATLFGRFSATAARHPDLVALEVHDQSLTYAELDRAAGLLANLIHDTHGGAPVRVGLLASRSLVTYVGYLATLRLGATVVPMGTRMPLARNLDIAEATGFDFVLADEAGAKSAAALAEQNSLSTLAVTDVSALLLRDSAAGPVRPAIETDADGFAYIMFTSGSTGRPKGVPIRHRNFLSLVDWEIDRFGFGPGTRFSQTSELTFDCSASEIFVALVSGGTLVVPQREDVMRPTEYINRKNLTHWFTVPSIADLAGRIGVLQPGATPSLTKVIFGGERLLPDQVELWALAAPNSEVFNTYGPTEVSVMSGSASVAKNGVVRQSAAEGSMPIGHVNAHLEHVVIDEGVPAETGELCLRGAQRFDGYLDPAHNIGRFLSWEPGTTALEYDGIEPLTDQHWYRTGDRVRVENGELVFVGRLDDQIKIRGNRVELGDIEATLRTHPEVRETALVTYQSESGMSLAAFYTGRELPAKELTAFILGRLPVYMLPNRFIYRDALPLNPNGKIDRKTLAAHHV